MLIRPDRRMYTKVWMVLATITVAALVAGGLTHLGLVVFDADNLSTALTVLWSVVGGSLLLMWLVAVPIALLWIRNLSYEITDEDVLINKGILTKIEQSIPLRMITDFRLNRSLYDRWLGIGSIDVQTAGQSVNSTGYEGRLSGLAQWPSIHVDLKSRLHRGSVPLSGVTEPAPQPTDGELRALLGEVREIRHLLETSGR